MTEEAERRGLRKIRLWLVLAALAILLAVVFVPSMISIGRYRNRITELVSVSLGRPVHLSSVALRLLPRPEFVLTDLSVDEDPAYGVEPVLHASTVTAAIRFWSLLRGQLAISTISMDEASLNLVRNSDGQWNLDPIFRTAAARTANPTQRRMPMLPYLEATNSRIHIKRGLEKLPFSLVNADLSFWEENPGDWRLRLRGQPARTDVNLDLADTGIVRLEASLRRAPELREMPLHVEIEWREAQLGQLSRLILGSDPGWRGDLTGQMQLDGTADSAQVKTRLSATGVHRAEFEPVDALDFDANCNFVYHYSGQSIEHLACDSPLGDGHVKLSGELPSNAPMKLAIEVAKIPISAVLGALRTVRSGIADDLEARGTISGQLTYDPAAMAGVTQQHAVAQRGFKHKAPAKNAGAPLGSLQGSLEFDGFSLTATGLKRPLQFGKVLFAPALPSEGNVQTLSAQIAVPADGPTPLALTFALGLHGYQATVRGPAALPRLRELAHVAGIGSITALDNIAGDPAELDLTAQGPWLRSEQAPLNSMGQVVPVPGQSSNLALGGADAEDLLQGTIVLRNANWKSTALANAVVISSATLHVGSDGMLWNPVAFTYGPVKGTAVFQSAQGCTAGEDCPPQLNLHFDSLDSAALQAALLGAHQPGTVLSTLIARFTPASAPVWPRLKGSLKADTLILDPLTLKSVSIAFTVLPSGAEITSVDASGLGGLFHATGALTSGDKPAYVLEGAFENLNGQALCGLLKLQCSGGPIDGSGKVSLSGFTDRDLAGSATGSLHFEWKHGAIQGHTAQDDSAQIPKTLARFDHWNADASIGQNAIRIGQNQVQFGGHKGSVDAVIDFGAPPHVLFPAPKALAHPKQ